MNENKIGDKLDEKDAIGNTLYVGRLVHFVDKDLLVKALGPSVAKITGYNPAGIIKKDTLASVRIVFDITIPIPPGLKRLPFLLSVPNPESEEVVNQILRSELTQ
jgi:hypothetical protein